jgi:hypothetical protein
MAGVGRVCLKFDGLCLFIVNQTSGSTPRIDRSSLTGVF